MWVQNMNTGETIGLVKWGDTAYLPVENGMHIGIAIHNDNPFPIAIPTYIEARNLWDGGPAQPEQCSTDHMWEVMSGQTMVIDALMNPAVQRGRPLVIVSAGEGLAVGEATFGTERFRGQIHLYERQGERFRQRQQSFTPESGTFNMNSEGLSRSGSFGTKGIAKGGASIGAGAEERRSHRDTGLSYRRHSPRIAALQVENRADLRAALGPIADFSWSMPIPRGHWWTSGEWGPWVHGNPRPNVGAGIPVAQPRPHVPHG